MRGDLELALIPPVRLGYIGDLQRVEPLLVAQRDEEVYIREVLPDGHDCWVREVVVVVVRDDDGVDEWDIFHLTWHVGEALRARDP